MNTIKFEASLLSLNTKPTFIMFGSSEKAFKKKTSTL